MFSFRYTHAPCLPSTRACAHFCGDSSAPIDPQPREPRPFHVKHSLGRPLRLCRAHAVRTLSLTPDTMVRGAFHVEHRGGWPRRTVLRQPVLASSLRINAVMTPGAISLGGAPSQLRVRTSVAAAGPPCLPPMIAEASAGEMPARHQYQLKAPPSLGLALSNIRAFVDRPSSPRARRAPQRVPGGILRATLIDRCASCSDFPGRLEPVLPSLVRSRTELPPRAGCRPRHVARSPPPASPSHTTRPGAGRTAPAPHNTGRHGTARHGTAGMARTACPGLQSRSPGRQCAFPGSCRLESGQARSRPGSSGAMRSRMRLRSSTEANSTVRRPLFLPRSTLTRVSKRSERRVARPSSASER